MSDARFNRLVVFFGLFGWLAWSVDLFVAPRSWWTVLVLSLTIGAVAVCAGSAAKVRS